MPRFPSKERYRSRYSAYFGAPFTVYSIAVPISFWKMKRNSSSIEPYKPPYCPHKFCVNEPRNRRLGRLFGAQIRVRGVPGAGRPKNGTRRPKNGSSGGQDLVESIV